MLPMCTQVFLGISDKSKVSQEPLSLAGCITDHLIHKIDAKPDKLALLAQIPSGMAPESGMLVYGTCNACPVKGIRIGYIPGLQYVRSACHRIYDPLFPTNTVT